MTATGVAAFGADGATVWVAGATVRVMVVVLGDVRGEVTFVVEVIDGGAGAIFVVVEAAGVAVVDGEVLLDVDLGEETADLVVIVEGDEEADVEFALASLGLAEPVSLEPQAARGMTQVRANVDMMTVRIGLSWVVLRAPSSL